MGFISKNAPLFLTDGTPVDFVKTTSKGNLQVKLPDNHPFAAGQDAGRIFRANGGAHYKSLTELKLTNTATASAPAAAPAPVVSGGIDTTAAIFASDGTRVTFVKITPKRGLIQVRFPDGHPFAAGQGNGRLYKQDGTRDGLKVGRKNGYVPTITNTAPASTGTTDATPPVAGVSTFGVVTASGSMLGDGYDSFDAAVAAATSMLADGSPLSIVEISTKTVGTVGVAVTRS